MSLSSGMKLLVEEEGEYKVVSPKDAGEEARIITGAATIQGY